MIVFAHLLNDASGSPIVLKASISAIKGTGERAILYLGSDGDGVLSECGIPVRRYWYRRTQWRLITLFTYVTSQILLLVKLLADRDIDRNAIVYVNTLLPFGAALYGWVTRRKVVYHIHEMSISPAPLRWGLLGVASRTSRLNLYVSDAHQAALPIQGTPFRRIYNALNETYASRAAEWDYQPWREGRFIVLMIASLRNYKGVPEFVALAQRLSVRDDIRFELVVNDDSDTIRHYFGTKAMPLNLTVYPRVSDTSPFYERAALVLNLTRLDQCVETFGLTLLEAMAYGIPVIAPPVGGPVELINDGVEGFLVDSRDARMLDQRVMALAQDTALCIKMSAAGRVRAARFSEKAFSRAIREAIHEVGCA